MGEPYWYADKSMFSTCCGSTSLTEIVDRTAICGKCKEWADFESEEEYYKEEYEE